MSYKKQTFSKGQVLTADALNTMSEGIASKCGIIDVNELPKGGWKGTAVPNSGTVENVYFNTNLTNKEIDKLLSELDYVDMEGMLTNFLLCSSNGEVVVYAVKVISDGIVIGYGITAVSGAVLGTIFSSDGGWGEFNNPSVINSEVLSEMEGTPIGTQNELLSSLFSTTPFEYVEPEIDDKSIYRIEEFGYVKYYGYDTTIEDGVVISAKLNEYTSEALQAETNINFDITIVDVLPEIGKDFAYEMLSTQTMYWYYVKPENTFYAYSGVISSELFGLEANTFYIQEQIAPLGLEIKLEFVNTVDDIPACDSVEISNTCYVVPVNISKYFIYDTETKWTELITTSNINNNIPEKHLYEWSIRIMDGNSGANTNFYFTYLSDTEINNTIEEPYTAKEVLDQIGRKTTSMINPKYHFMAGGKHQDTAIHYLEVYMIDSGAFNWSVRILTDSADTDIYIDAETMATLYASVVCRQIF